MLLQRGLDLSPTEARGILRSAHLIQQGVVVAQRGRSIRFTPYGDRRRALVLDWLKVLKHLGYLSELLRFMLKFAVFKKIILTSGSTM